jgi:hypothetical protein
MGQAKGFMVSEQDDGLEFKNFDFEDDNEIEVTKVKIGNNCVVVANEQKNRDAFFMVIYNKPLHRCMETFVMVGGTFGTKVTYFCQDYGISKQHDQCSKPFLYVA